jgi:hypothetical protein
LGGLAVALVAGYLIYRSLPSTQLANARARWQTGGTDDYRIVVHYHVPLYECVQDFDVRDGQVDTLHRNECPVNPVVGSSGGLSARFTVEALFDRIAGDLENPQCGPNGCVCDGPIGLNVRYDAALGYPVEIASRTMPELRWRYPEYWTAQLSGGLNCPPTNFVGDIITVESLTPLKEPATLGPLLSTPSGEK